MNKFIAILFMILNVGIALCSSNSKIEKSLNKIIDYNQVCDLHYNHDMSDIQIGNDLNDAVNYVINSEIINNNLIDIDQISELRTTVVDIIY